MTITGRRQVGERQRLVEDSLVEDKVRKAGASVLIWTEHETSCDIDRHSCTAACP